MPKAGSLSGGKCFLWGGLIGCLGICLVFASCMGLGLIGHFSQTPEQREAARVKREAEREADRVAEQKADEERRQQEQAEREADAARRKQRADQREAERNRGPNMAKYNRIRDGMSYEEVVEIIGEHGEEISRNSIAGLITVMFQWKGNWGANMNAMFQNGRLISKAQFGLK